MLDSPQLYGSPPRNEDLENDIRNCTAAKSSRTVRQYCCTTALVLNSGRSICKYCVSICLQQTQGPCILEALSRNVSENSTLLVSLCNEFFVLVSSVALCMKGVRRPSHTNNLQELPTQNDRWKFRGRLPNQRQSTWNIACRVEAACCLKPTTLALWIRLASLSTKTRDSFTCMPSLSKRKNCETVEAALFDNILHMLGSCMAHTWGLRQSKAKHRVIVQTACILTYPTNSAIRSSGQISFWRRYRAHGNAAAIRIHSHRLHQGGW